MTLAVLGSAAITALKYAWPIAAVAVGYWCVRQLNAASAAKADASQAELAATIQSKVLVTEEAADKGDPSGLDQIP